MSVKCRFQDNWDALWIQRGHKHCPFPGGRTPNEGDIPQEGERWDIGCPPCTWATVTRHRQQLLMYKNMTWKKKIFLTLRMAFSQMPSESDLWETCLMFPKQDRERGGVKKEQGICKGLMNCWRGLFLARSGSAGHSWGDVVKHLGDAPLQVQPLWLWSRLGSMHQRQGNQNRGTAATDSVFQAPERRVVIKD